MAKKGGLGTVAAKPEADDPLDALFGGSTNTKKQGEHAARQSTFAVSTAESNVKPVSARILKSFRIDRELAVQLKVYAAIHETSGDRIVEAALRKFFADN